MDKEDELELIINIHTHNTTCVVGEEYFQKRSVTQFYYTNFLILIIYSFQLDFNNKELLRRPLCGINLNCTIFFPTETTKTRSDAANFEMKAYPIYVSHLGKIVFVQGRFLLQVHTFKYYRKKNADKSDTFNYLHFVKLKNAASVHRSLTNENILLKFLINFNCGIFFNDRNFIVLPMQDMLQHISLLILWPASHWEN